MASSLSQYFTRMKGQRFQPSRTPPKSPTRLAVLVSTFVGSFTGIAMVAALSYNAAWFVDRDVPVMTGAFGASAVLIYGAIEAPLSQPRNVVLGHIMSSLVGVSLFKLFDLLDPATFARLHWLLCALAVSVSLFLMQLTHTVHPPASATALIAVSGGPTIYNLGYWYTLCPVALGISIMMVIALLVNNVARRYPLHWWQPKTRMVTIVDQDMSAPIADFCSSEDNDQGEDQDQENDPSKPSKRSSFHSTSTGSPSTVNGATLHSSVTPPQGRHPQAQYAVFYEGDRHRELQNGETLQSDSFQPNQVQDKDLEHGLQQHHSIKIEMRGLAHTEGHQATIDHLQQRVAELERQLASLSSGTSSSCPPPTVHI